MGQKMAQISKGHCLKHGDLFVLRFNSLNIEGCKPRLQIVCDVECVNKKYWKNLKNRKMAKQSIKFSFLQKQVQKKRLFK